jgi:hypothetical protein
VVISAVEAIAKSEGQTSLKVTSKGGHVLYDSTLLPGVDGVSNPRTFAGVGDNDINAEHEEAQEHTDQDEAEEHNDGDNDGAEAHNEEHNDGVEAHTEAHTDQDDVEAHTDQDEEDQDEEHTMTKNKKFLSLASQLSDGPGGFGIRQRFMNPRCRDSHVKRQSEVPRMHSLDNSRWGWRKSLPKKPW